jgi:hypothetical protein
MKVGCSKEKWKMTFREAGKALVAGLVSCTLVIEWSDRDGEPARLPLQRMVLHM